MNLIEKVFIKAKNYSRLFDVQCRLSNSHKEINKPNYDKALNDFNEALTEFMREKILALTSNIDPDETKKLIEDKILKMIEETTKDTLNKNAAKDTVIDVETIEVEAINVEAIDVEAIDVKTKESEIDKSESKKDGDIVSPKQDESMNDFNSYFKTNVIGGVEIKGKTFKTDQHIAINRDICLKDSEIIDLIKNKKIIRCRRNKNHNVIDINELFGEREQVEAV